MNTIFEIVSFIGVVVAMGIWGPGVIVHIRHNAHVAHSDVKTIESAASQRVKRQNEVEELDFLHNQAMTRLKQRAEVAVATVTAVQKEAQALAMLETLQGLPPGGIPSNSATGDSTNGHALAIRGEVTYDEGDAYFRGLRRRLRPENGGTVR
jgi:hypothetical protein